MICERCGKKIVSTSSICPNCGTPLPRIVTAPQPPIDASDRRYRTTEEPQYLPEQHAPGVFPRSAAQSPHPYLASSATFRTTDSINVQINYTLTSARTANRYARAITIELICSLFGIFGIGWLMAGEILIGALLLAASVLLYWPALVFITFFTYGFGLLLLGPVAIGAVILNTLLFHFVMKRKHPLFSQPPGSPRANNQRGDVA